VGDGKGSEMVKLSGLLIGSFGLTLVLEFLVGGYRPMLAVIAALLLAHVLPTWFLAFHDFDRETERPHAFVYSNSGPIGFGILMASMVVEAVRPQESEGATVGAISITLLAATVAIAYWSSSGQSRKSRFDTFLHGAYPAEVIEYVGLLKLHRYHVRAEYVMRATMDGNYHLLIAEEWLVQTSELLITDKAHSIKVKALLETITRLGETSD